MSTPYGQTCTERSGTGQELEYEIENILELADMVYGCEPGDVPDAMETIRKAMGRLTEGILVEFLSGPSGVGVSGGICLHTENEEEVELSYPFKNSEFWEAVEHLERTPASDYGWVACT